MTSKKLVSLFLALLCMLCAFEPALSESLTSAEKESKYQAAVLELEAYLESGGKRGNPAAIAGEFDELEGYRQSRGFCNYAQALAKIANGEFDRELDRKLDLLSINQPFQEYLEEIGKNGASAIGAVRDLMTYALGRKAEQEGQREEAIAQYRQCIGFFDAAVRYESLMEIEDETAYIKALSMYDAGNYAGAYQTFASLNGYEESGEMMELIISKLGYVPANETDNPGAVTGLGAQPQPTQVTLTWSPAAHATEYEAAYRESGKAGWTVWQTVTGTSVTVTGLKTGTAYDFRVTAVAGKVRTQGAELTGVRTAAPTPTPLALQKVANLRVTKTETTEMTLSWSASAYAKTYEVSYRTHGTGSWKVYQTVSGTSVTVRGLSANTSYDFRVIAVNGDTRSPEAVLSGQKTAAPTATPFTLQKVANLRVTGTGTTEMTLSWTAAANAKNYEVSYRTHGTGSWKVYQTVSGTSITVKGLSANTSYDFRVIAANGGTKSPEAELTGQTAAAPTATSMTLQAAQYLRVTEANQDRITLQWGWVAQAEKYEISYRVSGKDKWTVFKEVTGISVTVTGLAPDTAYDLGVTAISGQVRSQRSIISGKKTARPLEITEIRPADSRYDPTISVSWEGGTGPYQIRCVHWFNSDHNKNIDACLRKTVMYYDRQIDNGRQQGTVTSSSKGAWINHLVPGQKYWIILKDKAGNEVWKEYTYPRRTFSAFSARVSSFTLKRFSGTYNSEGTTHSAFEASKIEKAIGTSTYYGFRYEISMSGLSGIDPTEYDFNTYVVLPNGDDVGSGGMGFILDNYAGKNEVRIVNNDGADWEEIMKAYGHIPTGTYKFVFTINDMVIGEKSFTVK